MMSISEPNKNFMEEHIWHLYTSSKMTSVRKHYCALGLGLEFWVRFTVRVGVSGNAFSRSNVFLSKYSSRSLSALLKRHQMTNKLLSRDGDNVQID